MSLAQLPNLISLLRLIAVVPVAWLLLDQLYAAALVVFALAGASDALDGFLAKQFGWASRLGGILDALADKVLLITVFVVLAWAGLLPAWLAAAVVARDVVIVAGAAAYHWRVERFMPEPSFLSKVNTFAQIVLVLETVWTQAIGTLGAQWHVRLVYAVLATTVLSGAEYAWNWGMRAWERARARRHE